MSQNTKLSQLLRTNSWVKLIEIVLLFVLVFCFIKMFEPIVKYDLILKQALVWTANIIMLVYVWLGLKLRGENWNHLGLSFKKISFKELTKVFLLSLLVFVIAIIAFVIGSIVMANITGIPEGSADMSGYAFLKDNLGMLFLTLLGVYIVSSFGEEVIYRGFLINRISEISRQTKKAVWIAVFLSSIIFGLVHFDWGPMGVVQTAFMGLALGICYIKLKKRLWILILAHAYMDTILMVQMYLASN